MPVNQYGIDAYPNWNDKPLGGGRGYWPPSWAPPDPTPLYDFDGTTIIDKYFCYVDTVAKLNDALTAHPVYPPDSANPYQGKCVIVFRRWPPSTTTPNDDYYPEIDFTGVTLPIHIPDNTILFGYRGSLSCEGALLFNTDCKPDPSIPAHSVDKLFQIDGPHVKIIGLRIAGYDLKDPNWYPNPDSSIYSRAIYSNYDDLEIENCEFYGWSKAAICIEGTGGSPLSGINIHHCYIHHNRHPQFGNGIVLKNCDAVIEANIFDYNMFSIAGINLGKFEAYFNLVLSNAKGTVFYIDCGTGANNTNIIIQHNSFWLVSNPAICIAGVPTAGDDISYNRFADNKNPLILDPGIIFNNVVQNNIFGQYVPVSDYGIEAYLHDPNLDQPGGPIGGPLGGGCGYHRLVDPSLLQQGVEYTVIDISTTNTVDALKAALAAPPQTGYWIKVVFVNVDINLSGEGGNQNTGKQGIPIAHDVTLCSDRGNGDSEGALLYTTHKDEYPLFEVLGENVRITGLRIAGPDQARHMSDSSSQPKACGIRTNFSNLEVDNCELFGWSHSSLLFAGGLDPEYPIIDGINIHHNYIHHNQMNDPGYGMQFSRCNALVEANIFDYNRHTIEGTGEPGTSYEARYNLQLNNTISHAFDMHDWPKPNFSKSISGNKILIHHNSFWLWKQQAIGLGYPSTDIQEVYNNFFACQLWTYPGNQNSNNDYINPFIFLYQPKPPGMIISGNKYGKP